MMILKEECGFSDEQLYEQFRFNLLYQRALGMVTLDEQCPAILSIKILFLIQLIKFRPLYQVFEYIEH